MAKNPMNAEQVKCDGPTDGRTDGPTKRGLESRARVEKSSVPMGPIRQGPTVFGQRSERAL